MTRDTNRVTGTDVPGLQTRTACPACGSAAGAPIYQVAYDGPNVREYLVTFYGARAEALLPHLAGGTFALVACPACGLVYHRDVPNEALQRLLYDQVIDVDEVEAGHANDHVDYFARYAQEIMLLLARLGRPTSQVRVLDFGMGMARWTRMAKAFGCDVYGYDPSPERQRRAAERGVQTLTREEIAAARFDVIHTEQVLEHRIEPAEDTQLLAGSLNPGGLLTISTPNAGDAAKSLGDLDWSGARGPGTALGLVAPLEHVNAFTAQSLDRMAERAGLAFTTIPLRTYARYVYDTGGVSTLAKNVVKPVYRTLLKGGTYRLYTPR
jgi:SAM-dependent methyltransferase